MRTPRSSWDWKSSRFLLRLALAYLVVPLTAPVLLALWTLRGSLLSLADLAGLILLYAVFAFAAMLVLGTPLLFLYSWRGWTGFFAFIAGGALCAAATYALVMRGEIHLNLFALFTTFGVVEGLALRLLLFGIATRPRSAAIPTG